MRSYVNLLVFNDINFFRSNRWPLTERNTERPSYDGIGISQSAPQVILLYFTATELSTLLCPYPKSFPLFTSYFHFHFHSSAFHFLSLRITLITKVPHSMTAVAVSRGTH
jgi:hypothetical protein